MDSNIHPICLAIRSSHIQCAMWNGEKNLIQIWWKAIWSINTWSDISYHIQQNAYRSHRTHTAYFNIAVKRMYCRLLQIRMPCTHLNSEKLLVHGSRSSNFAHEPQMHSVRLNSIAFENASGSGHILSANVHYFMIAGWIHSVEQVLVQNLLAHCEMWEHKNALNASVSFIHLRDILLRTIMFLIEFHSPIHVLCHWKSSIYS